MQGFDGHGEGSPYGIWPMTCGSMTVVLTERKWVIVWY